jgi:hypothetical protein
VDDRDGTRSIVRIIDNSGIGTMKKSILVYGSIAGFVIIVINTASIELGHAHVWLGYLVMFIAFGTIFVAIKQYRDQVLGGVITFSTALLMGLGISALAGVIYVLVWELYLAVTDFGFIETYANTLVEAKQSSGASAKELAQAMQEIEQFKVQYQNPLFRLPMTMLEIFPVGLIVSLVSAAVLRTHRSAGQQRKGAI